MRSLTKRRHGARFSLSALTVAAGLVAGLAATGPVTSPPAEAATPSPSRIYLGVTGDIETVRQRTGQALAAHNYGFFEHRVPSGRMVTVKFRNYKSWRNTASLRAGSTGHKQIAAWADNLKRRNGEVFLAFHHEPESSGNRKYGTASEFKDAYRRVVQIFRARGATNVIFAWQMTAYSFRAKSGAYNYAPKWYPGNSYVDVVAPDPYNWYTCGHGFGRWMSLQKLTDPALAFARRHGKQVVLAEFGSVRDWRRPAWLTDGGAYLAANDNVVAGAFYFNRKPTNTANSDCVWHLTSDKDFAAFRNLAAKPIFKH